MKTLCLFVLDFLRSTIARMLWGKARAWWLAWFLSPVISYFVDMVTAIPLIKYILFLYLSSDFLTASCFNRALILAASFFLFNTKCPREIFLFLGASLFSRSSAFCHFWFRELSKSFVFYSTKSHFSSQHFSTQGWSVLMDMNSNWCYMCPITIKTMLFPLFHEILTWIYILVWDFVSTLLI